MKKMMILLPLLTAISACQSNPNTQSSHSIDSFISQHGTQLWEKDKPYRIAGTNNYYLHYKTNEMIDSVLDDAQEMGLNTIRIWGFMDGIHHGYTMQAQAGKYNPPAGVNSALERLDYTVSEAKKRGIRLVIVLTNNWGDFGGMAEYVKWFNAKQHDDFYSNASIKQAYKNYIQHIIEHTNSYTHIANNEEPTIMTWELANEPRAQSDTSGERLYQWAKEMSNFVHTLAPKQLIALGTEGFFNREGEQDWAYNGNEGVDWERLITLPNINYGTFHLYPEHWEKDNSEQWGTQWIIDHAEAAKKANKPAVLEEYGIGKDELLNRDFIYHKWTQEAYEQGLAGSMFWILTSKDPSQNDSLYPDYDGFRILNDGGSTATILTQHSKKMRGLPTTPLNKVYLTYPVNGMKLNDEKITVSAYPFIMQGDSLEKIELQVAGDPKLHVMTDLDKDGYYEVNIDRSSLGLGNKKLIAKASFTKGSIQTDKADVILEKDIVGYELGTNYNFNDGGLQGWEKDGTWQASWGSPAIEISNDLDSPMLKLNIDWSGQNDWEEVKLRNQSVQALGKHTRLQYDLYIPVNDKTQGGVRPYAALGDGWVKLDADKNRINVNELPIIVIKGKRYYKQIVKIELGNIENKLPDLFLCIVGDKLKLHGSVYIDNIQLFKAAYK